MTVHKFLQMMEDLEHFWLLSALPDLLKLYRYSKGGFKSEDTEDFFRCQNKYSKSLSWAENLSKLFTVLGGIFKFFAQHSELEQILVFIEDQAH